MPQPDRLQLLRDTYVDKFNAEIHGVNMNLSENALEIYADKLVRTFRIELATPSLGRCATIGFVGDVEDPSNLWMIPIANKLREGSHTTISHAETSIEFLEDVGRVWSDWWVGFSWQQHGRTKVFLPFADPAGTERLGIARPIEDYNSALIRTAELTPTADYYCLTAHNTTFSSNHPNVSWQTER